MATVLLMSFLLLMVVFRSLLVPLKAAVMNLPSIGASYGMLVAVSLHVDATDPVPSEASA